jgi:hypothetical protein
MGTVIKYGDGIAVEARNEAMFYLKNGKSRYRESCCEGYILVPEVTIEEWLDRGHDAIDNLLINKKITPIADLRKSFLGGLEVVPGRIYKLSGDVNELDYGAKYFRWDGGIDPSGSFEVWELDPYVPESKFKYIVFSYHLYVSDLLDHADMHSVSAYIDMDFDEFMLPENILYRLDAFISYDLGNAGQEAGNNANKLLGFNPSNRKYVRYPGYTSIEKREATQY